MTALRRRALVAALVCLTPLIACPCLGSESGYAEWFAGRILTVDAHSGRLRIARGPTETAGRGIEECVVPGANLRLVRPGMQVEAQADTRRRPWRILHLRVMERRRAQPEPAAPAVGYVAND